MKWDSWSRARCWLSADGKVPADAKNLAPLPVILLTVFVACGGNGDGAGSSTTGHPGTPPGNYTITVNGVVGSITRSTQVALTVQ